MDFPRDLSVTKTRGKLLYIQILRLQMDYGIGHWILYPESTHDSFSGEAFGLMYKLVDLKHVKFHINTQSVQSVEIPDFESKEPPVFMKTAGSSSVNGPGIVG